MEKIFVVIRKWSLRNILIASGIIFILVSGLTLLFSLVAADKIFTRDTAEEVETQSTETLSELDAANQAYMNKDWNNAIHFYELVIANNRTRPEPVINKGNTYYKLVKEKEQILDTQINQKVLSNDIASPDQLKTEFESGFTDRISELEQSEKNYNDADILAESLFTDENPSYITKIKSVIQYNLGNYYFYRQRLENIMEIYEIALSSKDQLMQQGATIEQAINQYLLIKNNVVKIDENFDNAINQYKNTLRILSDDEDAKYSLYRLLSIKLNAILQTMQQQNQQNQQNQQSGEDEQGDQDQENQQQQDQENSQDQQDQQQSGQEDQPQDQELSDLQLLRYIEGALERERENRSRYWGDIVEEQYDEDEQRVQGDVLHPEY